MSWQDTGITILRNLIWDNDSEVTYSDSRLEELLIVAASQIVVEIEFDTDYTVTVSTTTISPDPEDDADFMYFMTMKAACMLDRGNARLAAMRGGLEARCGPALLRTLKHMDGFQILLKEGYCGAYKQAKKEFVFGDVAWARAVLSPFVNENFIPYTDNEEVRVNHNY